jgi:hypothetical protein
MKGIALHMALGITAFMVYSQTSPTGVVGGDSGELMAMACGTGVAHPPGYPIITMLGKVWLSMLPEDIGTPAFRLSLLSAVLNSASAILVSFAAKDCCGGTWQGLLAGGMFAFAPVTWKYSQQFEVFALNNFLCSTLILLTSKYLQSGNVWVAYLGAVFCGLGIANQHTIILLEATLILAVIQHNKSAILRRPAHMLAVVTLFILAAAIPYAYLVTAGMDPPLGSWGQLDTLEGIIKHVTRKVTAAAAHVYQYCVSVFLPPV